MIFQGYDVGQRMEERQNCKRFSTHVSGFSCVKSFEDYLPLTWLPQAMPVTN